MRSFAKKNNLFFATLILSINCLGQKNSGEVQQMLQGKWRASYDHSEMIKISNNKIIYYEKNKIDDSSTFSIVKTTDLDGRTITAEDGKYLFVETSRKFKKVSYLVGWTNSSFSLMAYSNGQTVGYEKIRTKK
ncbi:hypothetical protein ACTHGU_09435 [Chitinophagaceae bacterium MMS25-I14]